jgi:hypothetical protein
MHASNGATVENVTSSKLPTRDIRSPATNKQTRRSTRAHTECS